MVYDMQPFLQSCIDRYQSLAGKDGKPLKIVSTPFHEERIARPLEGESEPKGALAPIAARVLMKILFAARMARYDLLRAVQGLAARVTKLSADCDKALHRLICYALASSRSSGEPRAGPTPNRLMVEICCSPLSKLSDVSRESASGCKVVQLTEKHNLLDSDYRQYVAKIVNEFPVQKAVILWMSLPCTGGTSWSYVNLKIPSAAKKGMRHGKMFKKLWKAVERFIDLLSRDFYIAIEWPQNCRYWRFPRVMKFMEEHSLKSYNFHGCMLGITDDEGTPIKKPWTVATSIDEIGNALFVYQCDGNHNHVQGRGSALRETESYSFTLTDTVHRSFRRAAESARNFLCAICLPSLRLVGTMAGRSVSTAAFTEKPPDFWKMDADFQVESIDPAHRLSVYSRVQEWERRLAKIRASCCACTFPDGYEGANAIGSGQVPVGDVVEALVGHDEHNTMKTYTDLVDVIGDIPAALFGSCICPPEGEADLIIVGDSSFALVKNHDNPVTCARLSFGELLQGKEYAIEQIRSVYTGLKWGKGLSAIVHQVGVG
eukprot:s912_g33.t1